jgi:ABC-type transport system involved in multi-copper enzyme maturation permease subunit
LLSRLYHTCATWLVHWHLWARLLLGVTLTGLAFLVLGGADGLSWPVRVPVAAVLVAAAVLILKRPAGVLFGPMLAYDLVRTARRHGTILNRCGYLACLWVVLYFLFRSWFGSSLEPAVNERDIEKLPRFNEAFFVTFYIFQYITVLIVTPVYTAGAIATEKANRTLDYLLTTQLTSREIVLGMLASRLANLFILMLAGLPVLTLLQFLGGLDPHHVFLSFITLALTMLSLGGVSILVSVHARTPLGAVAFTYLFTLVYAYSAPAYFVMSEIPASPGGGEIIFWIMLAGYTAVNLAVAGICTVKAVNYLRSAAAGAQAVYPRLMPPPRAPGAAVRQPGPPAVVLARSRRPVDAAENAVLDRDEPIPLDAPVLIALPPITDDALMWKELFAEQRIVREVMRVLAFIGIFYLLFAYLAGLAGGTIVGELPNASNALTRVIGAGYICGLFFCFALSASYRVSRERERQTLESLLTIPCEPGEILFAKWRASILTFRRFVYLLGGIWLMGLLTGGVHILALPFLVLAAVVYAALAASLGTWFSVACRTSFRAILYTGIATLPILLGPGVMWRLVTHTTMADDNAAWVELLIDQGLSPAVNLWTLCFPWEGISAVRLLAALAGLGCHGLIACLLWRAARMQLEAFKGPAPGLPARQVE